MAPRRITVLRNGYSTSGHMLVIKDDMTWDDFLVAAAAKAHVAKVTACFNEDGDRYMELDEVFDKDKVFCSNGDTFVPKDKQSDLDVHEEERKIISSLFIWALNRSTAVMVIRKIRESNRMYQGADMQLCFEESEGLKFASDEDAMKPAPDGNPNLRLIANNVQTNFVADEDLTRQLLAMSSADDDTSQSDARSDTSSEPSSSNMRPVRSVSNTSTAAGDKDRGSMLFMKNQRHSSDDQLESGASANTPRGERADSDFDASESNRSESTKKAAGVEKSQSGSLDAVKKTIRHFEGIKKNPADRKKKQKALDSILADPFSREFFKEFLVHQESAETLEFLRIHAQYVAQPNAPFAEEIYKTFIEFDGDKSLNLESNLTSDVADAIGAREFTSELFEPVREEIETFLTKTAITAFVDHSIYKHLTTSIKLLTARDISHLNTALHIAAQSLQGTRLQDLVQNGFPVNIRNRAGMTALHIIVSSDQAKEKRVAPFIQFLLKSGANPNIQDLQGNTPLHLAAKNNRSLYVETLLKSSIVPNLRIANSDGKLSIDLTNKSKIRSALKTVLLSDLGVNKNDGTSEGEDFVTFGVEWEIHPLIDAEHKQIVDVINRMAVLIKQKADYFDELLELNRISPKHNSNEEALMRRVNYPKMKKHSQFHRKLEKDIKRFADNYSKRDPTLDGQLLQVLGKWFKDHIFNEDKDLTDYLVNIEA